VFVVAQVTRAYDEGAFQLLAVVGPEAEPRKGQMGGNTMRPRPWFAAGPLLAALLVVGLLAVPAAAATSAVSFTAATPYPTGFAPVSLAMGDLNGDTRPDLMTANGSETVSVLLGSGSGAFGLPTNFGVGHGPTVLVVADFNGDHHLDSAVTNRNIGGPGSVSVLLGNGTGGFGPVANFATQDGPFGIAAGDLNEDGHPDLAVVSGSVGVLFGAGTGAFTPATIVSPFFGAIAVAIGDLNGDRHLDIVTANYYNPTVSVLLGDGVGGFAAPVDFGVGSLPVSVAIGDLNADAHPDIAALNSGSDTVSVLLNNGAGSFALAGNFATGHLPSSLAIGDLNMDGRPDLAVSNPISFGAPGTVSVLLGDGTGQFAPPIDFDVNASVPNAIVVSDLNSDGRPDLATANYFSSTVSVLLNRTGFDLSPCRLGCKQHLTINVDFTPDPNNPAVTVDLLINGKQVAGLVPDGGTSGPVGVDRGRYVISESGVSLTKYIGSVICTGESSASPLPHSVTVARGANIVCTITNTRR
jgi:hypothetical protein